MKSRLLGTVFACMLGISAPVNASVIYTYTGNNFDTINEGTAFDISMRVTGFIEMAVAIGPDSGTGADPISFSFSDGIDTIASSDSFSIFDFGFF